MTGTTPRCFFGGLPKSIVYDDFDRKIEAKSSEMRRLAGAAIIGSRAYQQRVVQIGLVLLAIAALLGITVAAAVTPRRLSRLRRGARSGGR